MSEGGKPLAGKVAVVTGGAKGIGFAIAEDLAGRGAAILVADLTGAEAAAERLRAAGHRAVGLKVDVASEADTAALAEVAGREPEVRVVPASADKPRVSCTIGEKVWRERWGDGVDFR